MNKIIIPVTSVLNLSLIAGPLSQLNTAMNQGVNELTGISVTAAILVFVFGGLYSKINPHVGKQFMLWAVVGLCMVLAAPSVIKGIAGLFGKSL